jgi:hypothetical protein
MSQVLFQSWHKYQYKKNNENLAAIMTTSLLKTGLEPTPMSCILPWAMNNAQPNSVRKMNQPLL